MASTLSVTGRPERGKIAPLVAKFMMCGMELILYSTCWEQLGLHTCPNRRYGCWAGTQNGDLHNNHPSADSSEFYNAEPTVTRRRRRAHAPINFHTVSTILFISLSYRKKYSKSFCVAVVPYAYCNSVPKRRQRDLITKTPLSVCLVVRLSISGLYLKTVIGRHLKFSQSMYYYRRYNVK
ncbi:hypothetical protein EVAR_47822_1 [Eumeta japonica]|uniref:Uncharacterized protein n=1 Tax=Eumeta variegata TaxID=151549 RepID=A0A4C1YYH9_EUMVA|nr:hypothetical protein EVAR_47822_1 [Eumeta japonica]